MKTIQLIFILFFIFSIQVFSQNPIIENTTICTTYGSTASITVVNPSLSETYVWQFKNPTDANWTNITISNAGIVYEDYTTSVLSIIRKSSLPVTQTKYRVIVTTGSVNLISNEAVLTVSPVSSAKTITGASAVCIGGDKQLTYASGSVGDIQWQSSVTSSTAGFEDINLENQLTFKATAIQENTWYRVVNTSGSCNSAYSTAVQVVVNTLPVAGSIEGGDINVCKTLNSTDLFLYYSEGNIKWQRSSTIEGPYTDITYATTYFYRASSLTSNTYYRAALSNGVCPTEYTEPVSIRIDPTSIAKTISGISQICTDGSVVLTYGLGSVGDIQWQTSPDPSISDYFSDEPGQTNGTLNLNNLVETTWVRVVNTSGECPPAYSPVFQVTVDELSYEGSIDVIDATVCKPSNTTVLTLYDAVGSIQWQKATDSSGIPNTFTNITSAIYERYTATNLTETTYFRAIVTNGKCPSVISETSIITVNQPGIAKSISGASPVCSGGSIELLYEPGSFGDIQWQSSTTGATSDFSDIPGETSDLYTAVNLEETTWYRVTNTSGVCVPVKSPAIQVVVNPEAVAGFISGGNTSVCKTTNTTVLSLNNYAGKIQWQKAPTSSGTYANISAATSATLTASNLTTTAFYRAVLSSGVCPAQTTESVAIQVESTAVSKTISGASAVCSGDSKTLTYDVGSIGSIQWQYSTTSSTSDFKDSIGENGLTYTASNLQQTTWFRVKNTLGNCSITYSPAVQVIVNTTPSPTGSTTQFFDFKNPVSVSNLAINGTNFKWYSTFSDAMSKTNNLQFSTPLTPGSTYYATQTVNGCVSIIPLAITVTNTLEIDEFKLENAAFYPNPFTHFITLKYPEIITSLELYNSIGQSVLKTNINDKETTLSVDKLPSGIYFIELRIKNYTGIIKAIKL